MRPTERPSFMIVVSTFRNLHYRTSSYVAQIPPFPYCLTSRIVPRCYSCLCRMNDYVARPLSFLINTIVIVYHYLITPNHSYGLSSS